MLNTVVIANNFVGPYGGAEMVLQTNAQVLKSKGYTLHFFGSNKQPYFESELPHQALFPPYTDFDALQGLGQKLKALPAILYSRKAKTSFDQFLEVTQPSVVYMHTFAWHLSASVIDSCQQKNIPVIHHVHDPRFFCPNGTLMRGGHTYCEEALCAHQGSHHAIINRCYDGNLAKSAVVATEFELKRLRKTYEKIAHFICPSQAIKTYMQTMGVPAHKITVIPNSIDVPENNEDIHNKPGEYFLYVGRLSKEKGVTTLLNAMRILPSTTKLLIIGTGPEEAACKALAHSHNLHNVTFLGWVNNRQALHQYYRNCIASVLPCNWFEAFGNTILETYAASRPVIASNRGGITELINDGETGFLIQPDNAKVLADKMQWMLDNPNKAIEMGTKGHHLATTRFSSEDRGNKLCQVVEQYAKNTF
jgi:glycosyltransferase involved in cell wall biosynthesis